jgi:hypothetical protein
MASGYTYFVCDGIHYRRNGAGLKSRGLPVNHFLSDDRKWVDLPPDLPNGHGHRPAHQGTECDNPLAGAGGADA